MNALPQRRAGRSGTFTGGHMLAILVAFFGVVISVNVTMAVLANTSWTGLEVKNSYVASQHFNERLAEARRQAALGWTSKLVQQGSRLRFILRDAAGAPIAGAKVTARVGHPVSGHADRTVVFTPGAPGAYEVAGPGQKGLWNVRVVALAGNGTRYEQHFRLMWKIAKQ